MEAREVRVRGVVQGVFFRATCRDEARARGVAGWARNEPDGSVSALFEGPPAGVDAMVEWCRHGPPSAVVDSVEVTEREPSGLSGFVTA